jgi:hypothetical protein
LDLKARQVVYRISIRVSQCLARQLIPRGDFKMKSYVKVFVVAVLLLAAVATATFATQVIYRTPRQLGQESALVIDGKVTNVRSYWNDTHTKIYTEAVVTVSGSHKGDAGSVVRIVQPGGVVGNVRMTLHGAIQWKPNQEVLLFLEPSVPGAYQVTGLFQGMYKVERDERSGKAYVLKASHGGADLVGAPEGQIAQTPSKLALDKFIDDVLGNK